MTIEESKTKAANYFYYRILDILKTAGVKDDEIDIMISIILKAKDNKDLKNVFIEIKQKYEYHK